MTWWLSFASDAGYRGCVLVDGCEDFLEARMEMMTAGIMSPPGCECWGIPVTSDMVPVEYQDAFAGLPRLTLLSKDDLRVLGPLVNRAGEER